MELEFLGTSSGTPTRDRNVTGLIIAPDRRGKCVLIDCGEATQHQLLRSHRSAHDLAAILITHVHGDHCYGLPGLLASAGMNGRKDPLTLVGPADLLEWIQQTQRLTALHLPFPIVYRAVETLGKLALPDCVIDAIPLSHRVPSYAYRLTGANLPRRLNLDALGASGLPRGPAWRQLQAGQDVAHDGRMFHAADFLLPVEPGHAIAVAGDNDRPECLDTWADQVQLVVHEATYTRDIAVKAGAGTGHSDAERVARWAQTRQIPNLVLTHFSARYQADRSRSPSIQEIDAEARSAFAGTLFLAEDFARFELDRSGQLRRLSDTTSNDAEIS